MCVCYLSLVSRPIATRASARLPAAWLAPFLGAAALFPALNPAVEFGEIDVPVRVARPAAHLHDGQLASKVSVPERAGRQSTALRCVTQARELWCVW